MNLTKKIRKSDDFEKMGALVSGMRNMVIQTAAGKDAVTPIKEEAWRGFIDSLLNSVEEKYYWTVASDEGALPMDESIEFSRFPTAVALAALALDMQKYPQAGSEQRKEVFQKAADTFPLEGYGEDGVFQVCEILMIFIEGNLPVFLRESGLSPELLGKLDRWAEDITEKLDRGDTLLPYGGDYKEIYKQILKGLKG